MTDKPAESAVERVIGFAYARGLDPWVFDMRDATSHRLDELYVFGDLGELAELSVLSLRINCIIWASEASRIREVKRQRDAAIAELKAELAAAEAQVEALRAICRHAANWDRRLTDDEYALIYPEEQP